MSKPVLALTLMMLAGKLSYPVALSAQVSPTTPKNAHVRILQAPELELARTHMTIVRWTVNSPGGGPVHYGIVHYGTDRHNLNQTASNPIRLNPTRSSTTFRVRMGGLRPGTTYYYTVGSMGADGTEDMTGTSVYHFTIPADLR